MSKIKIKLDASQALTLLELIDSGDAQSILGLSEDESFVLRPEVDKALIEFEKTCGPLAKKLCSLREFVTAWESSNTHQEVMDKLDVTIGSLQGRSHRLRKGGVPLKKLGKR